MAVKDADATSPDKPVYKPDPSGHLRRLLQGMARSVAAKGYAETTLADIVREANVSRRTFYEHFRDKPDCLIALYEAANRSALQGVREAIDVGKPWPEQVQAGLKAYFSQLAANPVLTRALFVDILHLGTPGQQARRKAFDELAEFIVEVARPGSRARSRLPRDHALAVVGAINELVLERLETEVVGLSAARKLEALAPLCAQLVERLAD